MASRQALALLSHARTASLRRVHFDNQPGNVSRVNGAACFDCSGLYLEHIAHSCVFSCSVYRVHIYFNYFFAEHAVSDQEQSSSLLCNDGTR